MKKAKARNYIDGNAYGFTLLEVLITLALLAFGLTALVNLQMKLHMTEVESYQRSQAIILAQDMIDRVKAAEYIDDNGDPVTPLSGLTTGYDHPYITDESGDDGTQDPLGKGDTDYDPGTQSCEDAFTGNPTDAVDRVKCEWSEKLKGAAEILDPDGVANSGDEEQIGGMIDARGCVEQIQAPNWATCTPAQYRVTVVWQGMHETAAPGLACGQNLYRDFDGDINESLRRAISSVATIGLPGCT